MLRKEVSKLGPAGTAVKYMIMMVHRSDIGRFVKEILRLMQAFRQSDLTEGKALVSEWIPGCEVIPTNFSQNIEYRRFSCRRTYWSERSLCRRFSCRRT